MPPVAGSDGREDELFTRSDTGEAIREQFDRQRRLAEVVAVVSPQLPEAEAGAWERDLLGLVAEPGAACRAAALPPPAPLKTTKCALRQTR